MQHATTGPRIAIQRNRLALLHQIEDWLERPMILLGFVWLALLLVEFTVGLSPLLQVLGTAIWALFVADFAVRFVLAPRKLRYLASNWLTLVSLALPALRVFRIARVLRMAHAARGMRLVKVLGSLNRGVRALRRSFGRSRFGFVLSISAVTALVGAAGLHGLEGDRAGPFASFTESLWWSTRMMMTIGPEAWPETPEGRVLALVLALCGYALFGYVTATFASLFIGRVEERPSPSGAELDALRAEVAALRAELRAMMRTSAPGGDRP
jgi:voltage-gated potassium channel